MAEASTERQEFRAYYFILEILLGFGILLIVNWAFLSERPAFVGVTPHPFWIVVVLVASRYGTGQGFVAGVIAALLYVHFGGKAGLDFSDISFPHGPYKLPFLFLLVGGALGEIRAMYKKRFDRLQERFDENIEQLQDLGLQFAAVSESKEELEKRIAFQSTTLLSLFERLNNLETLDAESLYARIPGLLKDLLNVDCASVYLIQQNKLRLYKREGTSTKQPPPDTLELTEGMMGEVIRTKQVVSVNRLRTEEDMVKFNQLNLLMSAPIFRKDESVIGVINVEEMPFFDYHSHSLKIFEMLAHWISLVVDKAIEFQTLKDRNIADEITGAYNYPYFQKRLEYEIARARRFKTPLSLLLLEIEKFNEMNPVERKNVLVVLNWIFSHLLREVDIIARFKNINTFAIILPGQGSGDTERVRQRLLEEVDAYGLRPFEKRDERLSLRASTSTLQITEGSYRSLVDTAEQRLRDGGSSREAEVYSDIQFLMNSLKQSGLAKTDGAATVTVVNANQTDESKVRT